jgi:hypothetical protein
MIGLNVAATREVTCQMVRGVIRAGPVKVIQSSLHSVCVWQPTEKVIEASIFHHDNDDMLDA